MDMLTFEELFSKLCERLSVKNKVQNISKQFSETATDHVRVAIAYTHLKECDLLFTNLRSKSETSKSPEKSTQLRNDGNKAFSKVNAVLSDALMLYTESIALAPYPDNETSSSEELALAFANRSAVFYAMKEYESCVSDINQALVFNYPAKLQHKVLERRGKCYQKMGIFEKASQSFQAALATSVGEDRTSSISSSLQQLEIEKESWKPKEVNSSVRRLQQKTYGENALIPCASDCLHIQHNTEMGRFVEATRDINPGDILLIEEPYASVVLPQHYLTHCSKCLKRCAAMIPCKYCSLVMYCSEICRSLSWKEHHDIECNLLPTINHLDLGKTALLALRIIIVATKNCGNLLELYKEVHELEQKNTDGGMNGFNEDGTYASTEYKTIHYLIGNTEIRTVGDLFKRATKAAYILNCLEIYSNIFHETQDSRSGIDLHTFIGGLLLRFLQSLPCNAHSVSDLVAMAGHLIPESSEFGCGAYATLSLINHSCDPNVTRSNCRGDVAILIAVRPIKQGEQILDNYGYHYAMQGFDERSSGLTTQYYFTCQCEACVDDWPTYQLLPDKKPICICVRCRTPLGNSMSRDSSGDVIVKCDKCQENNNVSKLEVELKIVLDRFSRIYEKLLAGISEDNFVNELSNHLQLLDRSVKRPWRLYNDCQEALKECVMREGNFYTR